VARVAVQRASGSAHKQPSERGPSVPPVGASSLPPSGWYSDPEHPEYDRYWDGDAWTLERRKKAAPPPPPMPRPTSNPARSATTATTPNLGRAPRVTDYQFAVHFYGLERVAITGHAPPLERTLEQAATELGFEAFFVARMLANLGKRHQAAADIADMLQSIAPELELFLGYESPDAPTEVTFAGQQGDVSISASFDPEGVGSGLFRVDLGGGLRLSRRDAYYSVNAILTLVRALARRRANDPTFCVGLGATLFVVANNYGDGRLGVRSQADVAVTAARLGVQQMIEAAD
jgi:hypothetical protein